MEHIFSRSNYVLKYRFSRKNTFFDIPIILPSVAGLYVWPETAYQPACPKNTCNYEQFVNLWGYATVTY